MELLLNAAWLGLAAALTLWALCRQRPEDRAPARTFLALACVLILLFPVISMTDDLYAQQFAIEDTPTANKLVRPGDSARALALHAAPPLVAALRVPVPIIQGQVTSDDNDRFPIDSAAIRRIEGRAPPLL